MRNTNGFPSRRVMYRFGAHMPKFIDLYHRSRFGRGGFLSIIAPFGRALIRTLPGAYDVRPGRCRKRNSRSGTMRYLTVPHRAHFFHWAAESARN